MAVLATNLGFPRMGPQRELKVALESYFSGQWSADQLEAAAASLEADHWALQAALGIDHIPSGDFSLYDHVADTAVLVGAIPERYKDPDTSCLERYFAMARGGRLGSKSVTALEMTKWFDTNYHYLAPELVPGQRFTLSSTRPIDQFRRAGSLGITTRPVLLGPVTFLHLCRGNAALGRTLGMLDALVEVYAQLLERLASAGAQWVQLDEPILCLDLDQEHVEALGRTYRFLHDAVPGLRLLVATYFSGLRANLPLALSLPVAAVHLDVVTEPAQLSQALDQVPADLALSLGIVDGRNVWRSDLEAALSLLEGAKDRLGAERLMVGPSCSLLHLPFDVGLEENLDPELRSWLAFAVQRLEEVTVLARGLNEGRQAVADHLAQAAWALRSKAGSSKVHRPEVAARVRRCHLGMERRQNPYPVRRSAQSQRLGLPALPTTTIGSFPQTARLRSLRARYRQGLLDSDTYRREMRAHIAQTVAFQEGVGLDVLVHGEAERNDMVEYFGDLLEGFAVTNHGWVQSYGSRCVKPPILYGDVARSRPMTVDWLSFAQSLTSRPLKGMVTGPVTMVEWSFVRNDQPLATTARQLALALRDEVADLEAAGIGIIQVDEPALREGLPLHQGDRAEYLAWAVSAFSLATAVAADQTQIHTHMCYADFNDVIDSIAALDADVISIEASRSKMALLQAFIDFDYPNEIGPGIWDIHSPRVPPASEFVELLERALGVLPADRLWVNPDCGLKTRRWEEVRPALEHLVQAAAEVRRRLEGR